MERSRDVTSFHHPTFRQRTRNEPSDPEGWPRKVAILQNPAQFLDDFSSFRMRFSGFHFFSLVQIIKRYGFVVYPTNRRPVRTNQSRTITSWYKRELKTRALCMVTHKSMHQLVFHRNCGHSANLWLFVRLFFPGPSRPNVETLYSCKFEVLPHSAPNGARASPRFPL